MKFTLPIVILNYNSSTHVEKNIESVLKYENKNDIAYQFIIIDNNSQEDDIIKLKKYISKFNNINITMDSGDEVNNIPNIDSLAEYDVIYIQMKSNHGFSYSNNVGLRLADKLGYKQAIISNPDTRVIDSNSVKNMLEIISNNDDIAVVFPQVVDPNGTHQEIMYETNFYSLAIYPVLYPLLFVPTKVYRKLKLKAKTNNIYTEIYTSIGCFFMIDLKILRKVDFFDEKIFLYGEEDILALKVKSLGKKLVCANNATILHDHILLNKENEKTDKLKQHALTYIMKNYLNYSESKINMVENSQKIYKNCYAKTIDKLKNK